MSSEKQFWLHLGVFLFFNQGLLVHGNSPTGKNGNGLSARQGLEISSHSHREPAAYVGLKSASHYVIKDNENVVGDPPNVKDVVQLIIEQEKRMDEADTKKNLVKRFVSFLRSAYPLEMPLWSEVVQNRVRRGTGWQHRKKRFLIKSRRRKQQTGKDKEKPESKMQTSSCGCKSATECPEPDEPDKFRLFFSNPPLCRPTSTPNLIDDIPSTDMCGHSCLCHNTEALTTDNDKEIFVGHRKTTDFGI